VEYLVLLNLAPLMPIEKLAKLAVIGFFVFMQVATVTSPAKAEAEFIISRPKSGCRAKFPRQKMTECTPVNHSLVSVN
jgi:hypothetical protein